MNKKSKAKYEFPKEQFLKELEYARNNNIQQYSDFIGRTLMEMVNIYVKKPNFRHYPDDVRDEMISYAIERCLVGLRNFKFEFREKICSYLLRITHISFLQIIKKYYKRNELSKKYIEDVMKENGCTDEEIATWVQERIYPEGTGTIKKGFNWATRQCQRKCQQNKKGETK